MRGALMRARPAIWLACAMGYALPLSAELINGGFEDPSPINPPSYRATTMPDWEEEEDAGPNSSTGIICPQDGSGHPAASEGDNWGFIVLANEHEIFGAFHQEIGDVEETALYELAFDICNIDAFQLLNSPDYRDVDTLVRVYFTIGQSFDFDDHVGEFYEVMLDELDENQVFSESISYLSSGNPSHVGQPLNVVFYAERPAAPSKMVSEVWFDAAEVLIDLNPVPEPGSLTLAGFGVVAIFAVRRFRRNRAA